MWKGTGRSGIDNQTILGDGGSVKFIYDSTEKTRGNPFYIKWASLRDRCTGEKFKERFPTYSDVNCCKDWLLYSNFKIWMENQPWVGMELDKDIIMQGNKTYCPEYCRFVPQRINKLLSDARKTRGNFPLGVYYKQKSSDMVNELSKPFVAKVSRFDSKRGCSETLGTFSDKMLAHKAWQTAKADEICKTVDWWSLQPSFQEDVAKALLDRAEKLRQDAVQGKETLNI